VSRIALREPAYPTTTRQNPWSHLDLSQSVFLVDTTVRRTLAHATPKAEILRAV
jgi:hypothetical protein